MHLEGVKIFCVMINIQSCSIQLCMPATASPGRKKKSRGFRGRDDLFLLFADFWWKIGHWGGRLRIPLKRGAGAKSTGLVGTVS